MQVKGVSSTFVRDQLRPETPLRWQDGFAVFSVSRSHRSQVLGYIEKQKQHHADGSLWASLEELNEEVPEQET